MKYIKLIIITTLFIQPATAQYYSKSPALLQPSGMQYFQNQYLGNPAMAGIDSGVHVNAAHRRQFNGVDGAPVTTFVTADGAFGNRGAAGLNIFSDVAGLLHRSRVALSYAYHMPLSQGNQYLHFGMSVAVNMQRVSYYELDGDWNDPSLAAFNRREDYFEGEFGLAYTDAHWTIQGALPNLRSLFTGKSLGIDGGTDIFAAAAYRFNLSGGINAVEPKVCYYNIKGFDDIVDMGLNLRFLNDVMNIMGMYRTSGSVIAGAGVQVHKAVAVQVMYNTQTGGVKTNLDNVFELGLTAHLFR